MSMGFSTNQSQLKNDKMAIFYELLIIKSKMASLPQKKPKKVTKKLPLCRISDILEWNKSSLSSQNTPNKNLALKFQMEKKTQKPIKN